MESKEGRNERGGAAPDHEGHSVVVGRVLLVPEELPHGLRGVHGGG